MALENSVSTSRSNSTCKVSTTSSTNIMIGYNGSISSNNNCDEVTMLQSFLCP
jgi:hypothetical protein